MENEDIIQEEEIEVKDGASAEQEEQSAAEDENNQAEEIKALQGEVAMLKIKLALLTGGASPEKLDEGVKLAAGLMAAEDAGPETAVQEVLREYPHIRLAKRSIPQFSAESRGSSDGFAAIRNIFARK
ncbi:MAG: hypothetical protein J6A19_01560 [Oscillospiraceae bacterium]|nr:hypothetical protein [Oscillospiraceae bacterium]